MENRILFVCFTILLRLTIPCGSLGDIIQGLDKLIDEFNDSYVVLFLFSMNTSVEPVRNTPIRIIFLEPDYDPLYTPAELERNMATRDYYSTYSMFLLLPDRRDKQEVEFYKFLWYFRLFFPKYSKVYVNIFLGSSESDVSRLWYVYATVGYGLVSIYHLQSWETINFVKIHVLSRLQVYFYKHGEEFERFLTSLHVLLQQRESAGS